MHLFHLLFVLIMSSETVLFTIKQNLFRVINTDKFRKFCKHEF